MQPRIAGVGESARSASPYEDRAKADPVKPGRGMAGHRLGQGGRRAHPTDGRDTGPARPVAAYATQASDSAGRLYPEPGCPMRTAYQRDRDRIIHATAFR